VSVLLAILALLPGPILATVSDARRGWRGFLDGLTIPLVGGLSLLHLVPHAVASGGTPAVVMLVLTVAVPAVLHRLDISEGPAAAIALGALLLHAVLEGAALVTVAEGSAMALAVAAHRVPVGLAVFSAARSIRQGWAAIALLAAATVAGLFAGPPLAAMGGETLEALLEAMVAGALLHVVIGGHRHTHDHPVHLDRATIVGAVLGVVLLLVLMAAGENR